MQCSSTQAAGLPTTALATGTGGAKDGAHGEVTLFSVTTAEAELQFLHQVGCAGVSNTLH